MASKKSVKKKVVQPTHNLAGNCWERVCRSCSGLCDVCHTHDEARGECDECERCALCDAIDDADAAQLASRLAMKRYPDIS